jgi:hypothetical protein
MINCFLKFAFNFNLRRYKKERKEGKAAAGATGGGGAAGPAAGGGAAGATGDAQGHLQRLYIVLHNIDGQQLRSPEAQALLGELAAMPRVHLIASVVGRCRLNR